MQVTPKQMNEQLGFKYALGDILQVVGRIPHNGESFRIGRGDPPNARVVAGEILVTSGGVVQHMYHCRAVHESGNWGGRHGSDLGLFKFLEDELEPYVRDADRAWTKQETK